MPNQDGVSLVVTPGGGGYMDGNPYTPNELVQLAIDFGAPMAVPADVLFEVTVGSFAAPGSNGPMNPSTGSVGCGRMRAVLPASTCDAACRRRPWRDDGPVTTLPATGGM